MKAMPPSPIPPRISTSVIPMVSSVSCATIISFVRVLEDDRWTSNW